ncbi:hypothetical protein D3C80_1021200 [compost metagenome]
MEEVLVGGDDGAVRLEIDHRQRLVERRQQGLGALQGGLLLGHVRGNLGDARHLAIDHDGEIGSLQPDSLARLRLADEAAVAGDAAAQILPQALVITGLDVLREAERTVVLANYLLTLKAHDLQEEVVDEGDHARRGKQDERHLGLDGLLESTQLRHLRHLFTRFLACFVIPEHTELLHETLE